MLFALTAPSGMPLNHELVSLGGQLVERTRTAPGYRLFVLPDSVPAKPGLLRAPDMEGPGIEVEIWSLDAAGACQSNVALTGERC